MEIRRELVGQTEAFLKKTLADGAYMREHPADHAYRLEHSYRVANIGKQIAEAEGFDPTEMVVACLLHDVAYCREFHSQEDWLEHGRLSAQIARPFLTQLGLPEDRIQDICYGIAIHVDDAAGFEGERTAFAQTISDADNIDRFDAYRIYETLWRKNFHELTLEEKAEHVRATLERLAALREMELGTRTAAELWRRRIDDYISFYEKLRAQLEDSSAIL